MYVIQFSIGTCQKDILGGSFFALTHFHTFRSPASLFPSYLFISIANDTHIIGLVSIVY